jgi:hypothetical protein
VVGWPYLGCGGVTIVNVSLCVVEVFFDAVADIASVYDPGFSLTRLEIRPANFTRLAPACPVNVSVPAETDRGQRRCLVLRLVCFTHRLPTLRPATEWANANLTVAASESLKPNVVPTGGFLSTLLIFASRLLSSHFEADWLTAEILGATVTSGGL